MYFNRRRWQDNLRLALPLGFFVLVWLSGILSIPAVVFYGYLILAGAAIIFLAVDHILTHYSSFAYDEAEDARTLHFIGALLWGGFWVMAGGLLIVGSLALWMKLTEPVTRFLLQRPGPVLILAGIFLVTYALSRLFRTARLEDADGHFLRVLPDRIYGVLLLGAGAVALGAGVWELLAPAAFDTWLADWFLPYGFLLDVLES